MIISSSSGTSHEADDMIGTEDDRYDSPDMYYSNLHMPYANVKNTSTDFKG
jgi:hypothetical protein